MTKGRRAFHNTVIGPRLNALRQAIRGVPSGTVFNTHTQQGLYWDRHTRLFLRPRGTAERPAA